MRSLCSTPQTSTILSGAWAPKDDARSPSETHASVARRQKDSEFAATLRQTVRRSAPPEDESWTRPLMLVTKMPIRTEGGKLFLCFALLVWSGVCPAVAIEFRLNDVYGSFEEPLPFVRHGTFAPTTGAMVRTTIRVDLDAPGIPYLGENTTFEEQAWFPAEVFMTAETLGLNRSRVLGPTALSLAGLPNPVQSFPETSAWLWVGFTFLVPGNDPALTLPVNDGALTIPVNLNGYPNIYGIAMRASVPNYPWEGQDLLRSLHTPFDAPATLRSFTNGPFELQFENGSSIQARYSKQAISGSQRAGFAPAMISIRTVSEPSALALTAAAFIVGLSRTRRLRMHF